MDSHGLYDKDGQLEDSQKVKPKCFNRPLLGGCSIGCFRGYFRCTKLKKPSLPQINVSER